MAKESPTNALRWADRLGWVVAGACVATVAIVVATTPAEPAPPPLDSETRARVGRVFASKEPSLRRRAEREFPGDPWTQSDHFHSLEQGWARGEARRRGTSVGDVLLAIDEDLRRHPPDGRHRRGDVAPCRPRPFYD